MKKSIILLFLICIMNVSSFAQATVETPLGTEVLQKFFSLTPTQAAKGAGEIFIGNKVKNTVGAVGGLTLLGVGYSAYEIKKHPEKIEFFLEGYPEYISTIEKYTSQYDWGKEYLVNIGIGKTVAEEQLDLENTNEWKSAFIKVTNEIVLVAENQSNNKECKNPAYIIKVWQALVSEPKVFDATPETLKARNFIFIKDPNLVTIYDVDSYNTSKAREEDGDGLDLDHIPAKATIRDYLNSKRGVIKLSSDEIKNLYKNTTIIAISHNMHKEGRTYKFKNLENVRNSDIKGLAIATTKDLANHLLYLQLNHASDSEINDFTKSAIILWKRNKALCLY